MFAMNNKLRVNVKERLVNDQFWLVLLTQLSSSQKYVNTGGVFYQQKMIICKFPSRLKTNLLKVVLCLQVFVAMSIEVSARIKGLRDFSSLLVFMKDD